MLPSCGYFGALMCPFLKLGYCERTQCHYKHESSQPIKSSSVRTKPRTLSIRSTRASLPIYVPTPVGKLKCHQSSHKSDDSTIHSKRSANSDHIPVYKPTPISELKKKQIGSYAQTSCDIKPNLEHSNDTLEIVNKERTIVSNVIKDTVIRLAKEREECDNILVKTKKIKSDISVNNNDNKRPVVSATVCKADNKKSKLKKLEESDSNVKPSETVTDLTDDSDEHFSDTIAKKIRIAHNSTTSATGKVEKKEKHLVSSQSDLNSKVGSKTVEPKINSFIATEEDCNGVTGKKRIAHTPKSANRSLTHSKRPTTPIQFGNKVPIKIRQLCLNKIIDEFLIFCVEDDAYKRGLDCEQAIYEKSRSTYVYKVLSAREVAKIRNEAKEKQITPPPNNRL